MSRNSVVRVLISTLGMASFAAILLVWASVVRPGWANAFFISPPSGFIATLSQQARSSELGRNLAVTLGVPTVIAITFLLAVTLITVSTLNGIQNVNPWLIRAARSFGANERDLLWKVVLPVPVPM
jgi:ABC-type nitrate/sulfonate/bicarbonate transport system permease component